MTKIIIAMSTMALEESKCASAGTLPRIFGRT